MAFSTRRFVKHIDKYGVVHRLEIQEDGFGGSESRIDTTGEVFQFEHETHAEPDEEILNVYENPVQKGSIELHLRIDNATDRTLVTDIFEGDEDDFRLVWKIDGSVFWTGTILNDMLEYPELDFPYQAKLFAKDFSRLEGTNYTLDDTRQTLITTFADLIGELGYSLDIETHTSWITEDTTDSIDFLQQIYHETKALRNFARTSEETDEPITVFEALEMMCRNFGCVVRQEGGVFKLIQYSEYETPSDVNVTVYNPDGTQKTAATSTDLTLNASTNDIIITGNSITRAFKAIGKAKNKYDHRTKVTTIQPTSVHLEDSTGTETYSDSQLFLSDGDQRIDFNLYVLGSRDGDLPSSTGRYYLQAGAYYWDQDNYEWTTNGGNILWNEYELTNTTNKPGLTIWTGGVGVVTDQTPADADGELEFQVEIPTGLTQADVTIRMDITNPIASENSTSIDYELTQGGAHSTTFTLADTWFGDGPVQWSVGALRHGTANNNTTTDSWQRRGSASYRNFHENLLKEVVDPQRGNRLRTNGDTLGADYDPEKILSYRSKSLAYTGGKFDGQHGDWKPVLFEINIQTASDDFDDIPKFSGDTDSQTGASSNDPTTGDFNPSTYDNRWFNIQNDLSEGTPSTMRANMGVVIGTDVQAWNQTLDDFVDSNVAIDGNTISATSGDLVMDGGGSDVRAIGAADFNQAVATRPDSPDAGGIAIWNLDSQWYETASSLTFGAGVLSTPALEVDDINIDGNTIQAQNGQNLVLDGNGNDVLVNGDTIKIDKEMTTTDNIIVLNDGEVGSGITAGEAGFVFDRGPETTDYEILFRESDQLFSIGKVGDLQPVLTREVSPDSDGLFYFDDSENRAITSSDLTFDGSELSSPMLRATNNQIFIEGASPNIQLDEDSGTQIWRVRSSGSTFFVEDTTNSATHPFEIESGASDDAVIIKSNATVEINDTLTGVDASLSSTLDVGGHVGSPDFASQTTDWRVTKAGAADFREVYSDEIHTQAFVAEVNEALVGAQVIGTSRAKLSRNFTVPSDGNTETLFVEDLEGFEGSQVFSAGDWVLLQVMDRSGGGLTVAEVWGKVTSYSDLSGGEQSWIFTTEDDGGVSGSTVFAGSIAIDYGQGGDGVIRSTVLDSQGAPYTQIETWTTDPSVASNFTAKTRVGILDGITNASGAGLYGENTFLTGSLLAGDLTKAGDFIEYASGNLTGVFNSLDFTSDSASIVAGNLDLNADGSSSYLSIGTLTGISDTTNKGVYVNNAGELLARQDGDNYLKIFDDSGTPAVDLATQNLSVSIDSNNSITADATGLDISAETFDLSATNILIDSANDRAKFGGATKYLDWNSGSLDAVMDSLDITIDGSNSIVADATGVDITAETFLLSTTDLTINSATPRIDVGSSHFLDGSTNQASFSGGVLTADGDTDQVGLVDFVAEDDWLYTTFGTNSVIAMAGSDDFSNRASPYDGYTIGRGFGLYRPGAEIDDGDIKIVHVGAIHALDNTGSGSAWNDLGFEIMNGAGDHLVRIGGDQAMLAGMDFNEGALVTGDGDLSSGYTAGTVTGMQPREDATTPVLFAGADDEDGTNAGVAIRPDGTIILDQDGEITNSNGDYSITDSGIQVAETDVFGGFANRAFNVGNQGRIYGHSDQNALRIDSFNGNDIFINTFGGDNVRIGGLPTFDPGVSGALYTQEGDGDLLGNLVVCVSEG